MEKKKINQSKQYKSLQMKKITAIFILCLLVSLVNAQVNVMSFFNYDFTGTNVLIDVSGNFKNSEIGGGIRFNINYLKHDDNQNHYYYKRMFGTETYQLFGANLFYHRYILQKWDSFKPFLFYDMELAYSAIRRIIYIQKGYTDLGDPYYFQYVPENGPFFWCEQTVGIGFKVKMFNNFYFVQKVGIGTTLIIGKDKIGLQTADPIEKSFVTPTLGYIIQTGILYSFNKKSDKK